MPSLAMIGMDATDRVEPSIDDGGRTELDHERAKNTEYVARLRHKAAKSRKRAAHLKHRAARLEDRARKFESRATKLETSEAPE